LGCHSCPICIVYVTWLSIYSSKFWPLTTKLTSRYIIRIDWIDSDKAASIIVNYIIFLI